MNYSNAMKKQVESLYFCTRSVKISKCFCRAKSKHPQLKYLLTWLSWLEILKSIAASVWFGGSKFHVTYIIF